jgi:phosphoribosylformylglycinamidine synthase
VQSAFARAGLPDCVHELGKPIGGDAVTLLHGQQVLFASTRGALRAIWSETTHALQRLRDDPQCADEEQALRVDGSDPGISALLSFDPCDDIVSAFAARAGKPRVAILREQGVNGQNEMAAAFDRAGFEAVDVHMSDLLGGRAVLDGFKGLAACGGFSYGDVLGAGEGGAQSILFNARARDQLAAFFARRDTFALGVCNGCQMMSNLHALIPGAEHWPRFVQNRSERYEARLVTVEVVRSPSILLAGMEGSRIPIVVAHGEGRAEPASDAELSALEKSGLVAGRYVDNHGQVAERYPCNPSGTPHGIMALTNRDGRVTIMMPHPERVFRTVQLSHHPREWGEDSPWMRLFRNARLWVA